MLQLRLANLKLHYTDKYPDVISTQQEIERLLEQQKSSPGTPQTDMAVGDGEGTVRAQVPNELHTQLVLRVAEATSRAATAKRKLAEAQSAFATLQARASEAPRVEAELASINRDYDVLRSSYDALLQRRELARVAAAADTTAEPIQFRLVAAPELPAVPSGPKRALLNALVLLLGLVAGCGAVVLLSRIDDHVVTVEDLAAFPNSTVLGCVSARATGLLNKWFGPRPGAFGLVTGALLATFTFIMVSPPNLSTVLQLNIPS
jgi:hypothetical protein